MSDIFEKINLLKGGKMCFGTERVRSLLDKLGSPDDKLRILHIAGTNGKGSIAEYLTQILVAAGYKTGTFTSPAVIDNYEQIRVDGNPLPPDTLSGYLSTALSYGDDCTSFEVLTAGALLAFARENCTYAVVECGLGGLNDATNAVNSKVLAIISSIGLEHTAVLGDTIEKICAQKAGIVKNCPLVVNALQPPEAKAFFSEAGAKFADKPLKLLSVLSDRQRFTYDGKEYEIPLLGSAQLYNAATAIEAARLLKIPENAIWVGLSRSKPKGRLQIFRCDGNIYIVDGAHNPSSFVPLKEVLGGFKREDVHCIFGCLSDKDIDGDLSALSGKISRITAVVPPSNRAMSKEEIVAACKRRFECVDAADSVGKALDGARGTVVVCGSFTLVKEAINWIEKRQLRQ